MTGLQEDGLTGLATRRCSTRAGPCMLGTLTAEFKLGVDTVRVSAHIGIALGQVAADAPALLGRARAAMAEQRRSGAQGIRLA